MLASHHTSTFIINVRINNNIMNDYKQTMYQLNRLQKLLHLVAHCTSTNIYICYTIVIRTIHWSYRLPKPLHLVAHHTSTFNINYTLVIQAAQAATFSCPSYEYWCAHSFHVLPERSYYCVTVPFDKCWLTPDYYKHEIISYPRKLIGGFEEGSL